MSERKWFGEAMLVLRGCYPGAWWGDDAEWRRRLSAYWDQLRTNDAADVKEACMRAPQPEFYPDRFPTAGQLARVVSTVRAERAERRRQQDTAKLHASELELERERRRRIPFTPEGQVAYVQEGEGEWEQLARVWECESVRRKVDPGHTTPSDMHERRMRDFWALWEAKTAKGRAA